MTPYELSITAKSYQKRQELQQKESIMQAYLISRWVWAKDVPIEKILEEMDAEREKEEMTDEAMLNQVKILNKLFGGEVKTCNS